MDDVHARIRAYAERLAAEAPPLTDEQRSAVAALFAASPVRVARRMGAQPRAA